MRGWLHPINVVFLLSQRWCGVRPVRRQGSLLSITPLGVAPLIVMEG
jgi:hypothetical protein